MKTKHIHNPSALIAASALFLSSGAFLGAQEVTIGGNAIEDPLGIPFTGNMIVEGDATVNGSLLVEPDAAPVDTISATGAAGVPPSIADNGNGTSTVSSRISTVAAQRIANTAGGVQIDANGNVALTPEEVTTSDFRYGIFSQFDVNNADNTPIGVTTYIAAAVDADGNFASELVGVGVDSTDPDPLNWTIDLNDPSLDTNDILVDTSSTTANGNLQVGGDANVDGNLALGAIADVEAEFGVNSAADQAYADTQDDAHSVIDQAYADTQDDAHSVIDQAYADTQDDAHSVIDQAYADTQDDAHSVIDQAYADTQDDAHSVIDQAYTDAREVAITNAYQAADANLQSQIDTNREDIDRNARGIAMVAALQHTTVLPGMTQALDLSAAHFEGETGMALNYARRINENVQINFGAASTSDFDESVIKAGIGWQW